MRTRLAELHCGALANSILLRHTYVLGRLHYLNSNFNSGDSMAAKPHRVAGALANGMVNFILIELIFKALGLEDGGHCVSSLSTRPKEDGAALVLLHNNLKRVPVEAASLL